MLFIIIFDIAISITAFIYINKFLLKHYIIFLFSLKILVKFYFSYNYSHKKVAI